ncbi:HlyD family efflux transporter periplasmic adaptor subunit [Cetobacterium somerae]|uniref:HlyD family secretion protein n=1 Tax=Cetobacterium TaxID=180162 RepID=UPI002251B483|nr:HlyD family efflux transporter periplasmic adaptor subunit [uncultured Cetobacterium sp.]MCX3067198.1 HlyD family efflux transporter periplasmic adaptor subunit [Cetobacterium somerae]
MEKEKVMEKFKKVDAKYVGIGVVIAILLYFIVDYIVAKREEKIYYGVLEMDKINVSSEIPGKIEILYVDDGYVVKKGQELVAIDDKENRLKVENSEINLKSSENQLLKTLDGTREEQIAAQREVVKQLETQVDQGRKNLVTLTSSFKFTVSNLENKKKIYSDTKDLFNKKFESQYNLDVARLNYENAQNQFITAKNSLENGKETLLGYEAQKKAADENLRYMINGFSKRDIESDKLKIQSSKKGLELAKVYADKNKLVSPIDGLVESVNLKIGEIVNPGIAVVTMLDMNNLWTKIYVPEKILPLIKLNQKITVKSDFIDKNYEGEIVYIASDSEFTPMNIVTKKDRLKLVYEIKVKVLNNDGKLKSGMLVGVDLGL